MQYLDALSGQVAEVEMSDSKTVKTVNVKMIRKYVSSLVGRHHPHGRERASSPGESSIHSSASVASSQRGAGGVPPTPEITSSEEVPQSEPGLSIYSTGEPNSSNTYHFRHRDPGIYRRGGPTPRAPGFSGKTDDPKCWREWLARVRLWRNKCRFLVDSSELATLILCELSEEAAEFFEEWTDKQLDQFDGDDGLD